MKRLLRYLLAAELRDVHSLGRFDGYCDGLADGYKLGKAHGVDTYLLNQRMLAVREEQAGQLSLERERQGMAQAEDLLDAVQNRDKL